MDAQTQSSDSYIKILEWLHTRRKPLVAGAIVVAVLAVVWAIVSWKKSQNDADANAQFFAVPLESPARSAPVSPGPLLDVAKTYPSTPAGEHAKLLAAKDLFIQGKYPEASQQFSDFLNNYPDSALAPDAKMGVAASLEAEGKTPDAIKEYRAIILTYPGEMSIVSPAKLTLARLYQETGQSQQALTYYVELARMLSQNPYDPWASEAQERAQLLVSEHPELMKTLADNGSKAPPAGFSAAEAAKLAGSKPATSPATKAPPAATPANQSLRLLTMPGVSSNAAGKPK